jgi:hypothetical protein
MKFQLPPEQQDPDLSPFKGIIAIVVLVAIVLAASMIMSSCSFTTDGTNHSFQLDGESAARALIIYSTK